MGVKFRVLDKSGKLLFQTGAIPIEKNFFHIPHNGGGAETYVRHGSDSTGYFSMNTCKDKCGHLLYGNKCQTKVCCVLLVNVGDGMFGIVLKKSQKYPCVLICMYNSCM